MNAYGRCRLCGEETSRFGTGRILGTYDGGWFRCGACELVQTEEPFWLEAAYSTAITTTDLGLASRNVRMSRVTAAMISALFDAGGSFVDYAGGYGLLTRLMRDAGYDFHRLDAYCQKIFAGGFEGDPHAHYELLTAFEVVEHLAEPMAGFREMAALSDNILFSTHLVPDGPPPPDQWWYYGLEHGQHIAFYAERSLRTAAAALGLYYCNDGREMHLLSRRPVPRQAFHLLCRYRAAILYSWWKRRPSLLESDFETAQRMVR